MWYKIPFIDWGFRRVQDSLRLTSSSDRFWPELFGKQGSSQQILDVRFFIFFWSVGFGDLVR